MPAGRFSFPTPTTETALSGPRGATDGRAGSVDGGGSPFATSGPPPGPPVKDYHAAEGFVDWGGGGSPRQPDAVAALRGDFLGSTAAPDGRGTAPTAPTTSAPSVFTPSPLAGSNTYGYRFDAATNQYVDANGRPSSAATPPSAPAYQPAGPNPFGIQGGGLMENPSFTAQAQGFSNMSLNPNYFATPEAAASVASQLGGTLFTQNHAVGGIAPDQQMVRLPNGQEVNVGNLMAVLNNPVWQQNQGVMNQEILNLLNGANHALPTNGSYVWQNGQLAYNPGAQWQGAPQTVADPAQYANWVAGQAARGYQVPYQNYVATPAQQAAGQTTQGQQNAYAQAAAQPQTQQMGGAQPQNQLAQLAQFFQLFSGGSNLQSAQPQGGLDMGSLLQLLMLLGGGQSQTGGLYQRSQYPRFP
jgi:hypothetical protein